MDGSPEEEYNLQKRFKKSHMAGEWFLPPIEILKFIEDNTTIPEIPQKKPSDKPRPGRKRGISHISARGAFVVRLALPVTPEQEEARRWLESLDPIQRIEWLADTISRRR